MTSSLPEWDAQVTIGKDWYLDGLRNILCIEEETREELEGRVPGLRFQAYRLASSIAKVTILEQTEQRAAMSTDFLVQSLNLMANLVCAPHSYI